MRAWLTIFVSVLLLWLIYSHIQMSRELSTSRAAIFNLTAKQAAQEETPSLEVQSQCSQSAKGFFQRGNYDPKDNADYSNHYNARLRKCFIAITTSHWDAAASAQLDTTDVFDAIEGRHYGQYAWQSQKGKKYYDVSPLICSALLSDGKTQFCQSADQFSELMSGYIDVKN